MSEMQKRKSPKPQPGCIGRMVKLFDMDGSTAGNKLLMDKPYNNGYTRRSCPAGLVMSSEEDDHIRSQFGLTSGSTPMKMHLDHELSKEAQSSKYTPPNLVARLMGLDALPESQVNTCSERKKDRRSSTMGSVEDFPCWQHGSELLREDIPSEDEQYHRQVQGVHEEGWDSLEHKHVRARSLAANGSRNDSADSEGVAEVFKSNKDLFLEFLQQPNSLFIQHLQEMRACPPCGTKRITVLKPSKTADNNGFPVKNEKWVTKPTHVSQANVWNKTNLGGFPVSSNWKTGHDPQPTRIVVLKPSLEKTTHIGDDYTSPSMSPRTPHGENCSTEEVECDAKKFRDTAKEITNIIRESLGSLQMDDSFFSVLSSGYNGDESSPNESEYEHTAGSDSEVMSPTSRFSWDYINKFASCSSSVSHEPHTRESSVCREAKKRLSRRWSAVGINGSSQEQRHARSHSSYTLGEMLALSGIKKSIRSPDNNGEDPMGSSECQDPHTKEDRPSDYSPRNLMRSKSVPLSSNRNCELVKVETAHPEVENSPDEKELVKTNSLKSLVASLFFSRNKKSDKEKTTGALKKDGSSATSIRMQGQHVRERAEGTSSHEVGLSVTKPTTAGNLMESQDQDQPSPISVLEPLFADDDIRSADSSGILSTEHPVMKTSVSKANSPKLGKSPPIESVARTLCWNSTCADTVSACPFNISLVCSGPEEERDWSILVHALLSTVGLSNDTPSDACMGWWHGLQTPLDPLLRDKYANAANHSMHEAKRRRWRSNRKLIFDSVNQALIDKAQHESARNMKDSAGHPETTPLPMLVDLVWATLSQWISDEARCVSSEDGEGSSHNLVVERVVRREVAGKRWVDGGSCMEVNMVGNVIEQELLDELLEEAILQLTPPGIVK